MTKIFACERWYDDTWWETEAPDDWNFRQDKTIKNWPHIFESPSGSKLTVWASKHVKVDRAAWQPPLPIELKTEGERTAYQLAELPGSHAGVSQLEKRALGRLVGFTRKTTASNSIGWCRAAGDPTRSSHAYACCAEMTEQTGVAHRAGLIVAFHHMRNCQMPIRTATVTKRISANGQALHRAMMSRMEAGGGDQPSEAESALIEERRLLKEERDKRKAQALLPRPSALDRLVRTHHAQAKDKPKAKKETQAAHDAKKAKPHRTRAEKHAEKAAALEAARRSPKKPAK